MIYKKYNFNTENKKAKMENNQPWDDTRYFEDIDILSLLPTKKLREIEKEFPSKVDNESNGLSMIDFLITMH